MLSKKKVAAILLGAMIGVSGSAFAAGADSLVDVPKDHWSYEALDYLAKNGIIEGMGDSTFQGNRTMTRYEMARLFTAHCNMRAATSAQNQFWSV